jgi:magnesium-transporting ATPase (P-type)
MRYDNRKFNAYQNAGVDGADFRENQIKISHRRNNSYRGNKYQVIKNILTNKWFLIIGLPIILLFILYVAIWFSYGQLWANLTLFFIIILIVFIILFILFPPKRGEESILERAEREKGRLQEEGRQQAQRGDRRRGW